MKELSIFIDESGDFGKYNHISPYYDRDIKQTILKPIKKKSFKN